VRTKRFLNNTLKIKRFGSKRAKGPTQDSQNRLMSPLITKKLLIQAFLGTKLKSSLRGFYGRHHVFVTC